MCTYKIIYIFLSYSSKNNWTRMFFGSWQWHMLYRARYWSRGMLLHHRPVQRWCQHSLKHPGYLWHHPGIAPSIELLLTCHLICLQKKCPIYPPKCVQHIISDNCLDLKKTFVVCRRKKISILKIEWNLWRRTRVATIIMTFRWQNREH